MKALFHEMLANAEMIYKSLGTGLSGFVGVLDAYVAINTHNPLTAASAAALLYITAEAANQLKGSEKFLIERGINSIKHYFTRKKSN